MSLPIIATAGPGPQAPDLRADPVEGIIGPAVYGDTEGGTGAGALLVRFDGFVTNVGAGPLEVSGNPQVPGGVRQLARTASGGTPSVHVGTPEVRWEPNDTHNHFHLMRAMRYSLWNQAKTAQVAPGQKVGFCLYDLQRAPGSPVLPGPVYTDSVTNFCRGDGGQSSTTLRMGTSPGWRDVYNKSLAYQWVDVSNTAPGVYVVASEADPDGVIWEGGGAAEYNPPAFSGQSVIVPGWTAQPVSVVQTGAAQGVPLAAQKFGTQGDSNLRYRIASPPANGTLNVAVGQDFSATDQLVYTPNPGFSGDDAFTYVARSASSNFPLSPPAATVSVVDTRPSVAISGAPASMVAGTAVQLTASVKNLPAGVRWGASSGSIAPTGLYRAPKDVPKGKGGAVLIRATSTANAAVRGEVTIAIKRPPKATARPDPFGRLTAGRKLLSPLRVVHIGRRIVIGKVVTGRKSGRVAMTTTVGRRVLGRCVSRIGARKGFTCKVTMRRSYPLKKVKVTARFVAKGGAVAVRRTFVVR